MKQINKILLFLILLSIISCEKKIDRIDDFFIEFATFIQSDSKTGFRLDNNRLLIPKELKNYKGTEGQRVILNYTPLKGDTVKVNQVSDIHTDKIREADDIDFSKNDPVEIQSVWVSGDYLNLILEIEFYSEAHKIGVIRNSSESSTDIYFIYSRENDPPGYAKKTYASFLLTPLKEGDNEVESFKFHIQTTSGKRTFEFEYN